MFINTQECGQKITLTFNLSEQIRYDNDLILLVDLTDSDFIRNKWIIKVRANCCLNTIPDVLVSSNLSYLTFGAFTFFVVW